MADYVVMAPLVSLDFPELKELEDIIESLKGVARVNVLAEIEHKKNTFPLYSVELGVVDRSAPVLALFAGVHGLERIGSRVLLAYLKSLAALLTWDESIHEILKKTRIVLVPIINPMGMRMGIRSNANGVDLMRNAPVEADRLSKFFLMGGHRFTNRLPWYRGPLGAPMELEAVKLCEFVKAQIFDAKVAISVDVHSGYGSVDRLWFPYARTKRPFPNLPEAFALKELLDRTFPNHVYQVEPQSLEYLTHGDLWDFLYDQHVARPEAKVYLPLCLEMGSWIWIKKNPKQIFTAVGAFNPLVHHRARRTLRRHLLLFDFLLRAVHSARAWSDLNPVNRETSRQRAIETWYPSENDK
jgi:hypothetical protein